MRPTEWNGQILEKLDTQGRNEYSDWLELRKIEKQNPIINTWLSYTSHPFFKSSIARFCYLIPPSSRYKPIWTATTFAAPSCSPSSLPLPPRWIVSFGVFADHGECTLVGENLKIRPFYPDLQFTSHCGVPAPVKPPPILQMIIMNSLIHFNFMPTTSALALSIKLLFPLASVYSLIDISSF